VVRLRMSFFFQQRAIELFRRDPLVLHWILKVDKTSEERAFSFFFNIHTYGHQLCTKTIAQIRVCVSQDIALAFHIPSAHTLFSNAPCSFLGGDT